MIFSASPPFSNQNISLFNASLENEKREGGEREGKEGWRTWGGAEGGSISRDLFGHKYLAAGAQRKL